MFKSFLPLSATALLTVALLGCSSSSKHSNPKVLSTTPPGQSIDVPVNAPMTATFSEPMDPATLNDVTFTVTFGLAATPVAGTVVYVDSTASFWPTTHLSDNVLYTAKITAGAANPAGQAIQPALTWTFTTGTTMEPGRPVVLGRAGDFAVLAKAAVSTVPASAITGNVGISPAAATFITGFGLTLDASNQFSIATQVTGQVFAADYAVPTPAKLTTAVLNMENAFTDAAGRAADVSDLGAGNIGGLTLAPGVYRWGTGLLIPTDLTLSGSATDIWIFQIAQDLSLSNATNVILTGGALPENVFWQVTGQVTVGTTAQFNGILLCATAITLQTGASINGRLLAQTAISLDAATVVEPTP